MTSGAAEAAVVATRERRTRRLMSRQD